MTRRRGEAVRRSLAERADKFELYERSVQDTDFDIRFIRRVFRRLRGGTPRRLREDFCGTAKLCADWVRRHPSHEAVGLDLHGPTLAWGRRRHVEPLGEAARRVTLLERNVLDGAGRAVDVTVAFNFSYWVFLERSSLRRYFESVHRDLGAAGLFFLDIHGGPDAQRALEEETEHEGFTYVWEQAPMDALSARAKRYIHFRFPDGSELRRAFRYDWRIWSLPEVREVLMEAGFQDVLVYWEGADENGEGNGIFRPVRRAENEDSWIAYIVGVR